MMEVVVSRAVAAVFILAFLWAITGCGGGDPEDFEREQIDMPAKESTR